MKKNKIAKRFGIASLCLVTALSAFSGIASQKSDVALADGEIAVADFIHTNAETVTPQKAEPTTANGSTTVTGVRLSSDVAYEGTFKTVFKGNASVHFKFPELYDSSKGFYGDFKIRVADVDDDSHYFEVVYGLAVSAKGTPCTTSYLQYTPAGGKTQVRSRHRQKDTFYNKEITNELTNASFPSFLSKTSYATGYVGLTWTDDVLAVKTNKTATGGETTAEFDGTYNAADTSKYGFVNANTLEGTQFGLPKLADFKDGYTISFSSNISKYIVEGATKITTTPTTTDKGTDVLFTSVKTRDLETDTLTTYDLSSATIPVDDGITRFNETFISETPTVEEGKVFIGWKGANGSLYPASALLRKSDSYDPVEISYDVVTGASVRIVVGGESGLRFQTMLDADGFEAIKDSIHSFGTLLTYTETLTTVGKDFTIDNYQDEESFQQVQNIRGMFEYRDKNDTLYKAYTVAIVNLTPEEYTVKYSARGYLKITYADGVTRTFYTDYSATENSRSVAEVASRLKTDTAAYEALTADQKELIDLYATAQN